MKTAGKIILAGVIGTSLMTLYSYIISRRERQEFTEPFLLNKLIDGSDNLPDVNKKEHPAGWLAHYGVGILFVIAYRIIWKESLRSPGIAKSLVVGSASGAVAIAAWKLMFSANENPPHNDRYRYYRQLFVAHLIFSLVAIYGYKLPDYIRQVNSK